MRRWFDYVEEAKEKLSYQETQKKVRELISSLEERGLIKILKEWEEEDFPFLDFKVETPWCGEVPTLGAVYALSQDDLTSCSSQEVTDFVSTKSDLVKTAFSLFYSENRDKLFIKQIRKNIRWLVLHLDRISDKDVFLVLAERWEPVEEEEEEL